MTVTMGKLVSARKIGWITSLEFLSKAAEVVDGASVHLIDGFSEDEIRDVRAVLAYHGVPKEGAKSVGGDPICVSGWRLIANKLQ